MNNLTDTPSGVDANLWLLGHEELAVAQGTPELEGWDDYLAQPEYATASRSRKAKCARPSAGVARESGAMKGLSVVILGVVVLVNAVLIGFAVSGAF